MLPLRDIVVFPRMIVPLFVGRDRSVRALEEAMNAQKKIFLVSQKNPSDDDPSTQEIYTVGTLGTVLQLLRLPDGTVKVLIEGLERAKVVKFLDNDQFYEVEVEEQHEKTTSSHESVALCRAVISQFEQYIKLNKKVPPDILVSVNQISEVGRLADTVSAHMSLKINEKQQLLEIEDPIERIERVYALMEGEISVLQVEKRIRNRVKRQMEKTQREYYLNEQMKAIQKELGDGDDERGELAELEDRIAKVKFTTEARDKALSELKKLKNMSMMSAEATVVRNYLDWMVSIPWQQKSRVKRDTKAALDILDTDHFGLEKVKERITEYLAVQNRVGKLKGPIICLVGPPGVGKTSLAKSIAKATGRKFVRLSLGGVRDEAEMRGHRRTYVGSMPGKIIQGMKKAKTSIPLFLLDEIDKLGADWRGDPSSALLEILDPEQNTSFNDHYLEVDYDLSDVMFVTTANTLRMPQPLLDRMEVILISGYTEEEKLEIAKRYLVPKQLEQNGLKAEEWEIDDQAIMELIRRYTREAGVRSLERELANLARKAVKELSLQAKTPLPIQITTDNIKIYSGVPKYRYDMAEQEDLVGLTTGLAWTEVGGDMLSIESVVMPGKGKVTITGKLGDVMQESVQAALGYIRSRATEFGIDPAFFEKHDVHLHVPEGATPKDGPSAGIAICCAIVSAISRIPVRKDTAMTGEITLRGRVLPIGGLKEKLLAAHRGGIKRVLIPLENEKDLAEIPQTVKDALSLIIVETADQVLKETLTRPLIPLCLEASLLDVSPQLTKKQRKTSAGALKGMSRRKTVSKIHHA